MPYDIEVISIGGNFDSEIAEAAKMLSGRQKAFRFDLPPEDLSSWGRSNFKEEYYTEDLFRRLQQYLDHAKGGRRFVIGVVDQKLRSKNWENLFGSRLIEGGTRVTESPLLLCGTGQALQSRRGNSFATIL